MLTLLLFMFDSMLEDGSWNSIVRWSLNGSSFVVVNMNDFTKHVLPRHFRHSNFASFVRQLNKYDFHKMKKDPAMFEALFGMQPGSSSGEFDQMWEFKHACFIKGRPDLLDGVKRKVPTGKKKQDDVGREGTATGGGDSPSNSAGGSGGPPPLLGADAADKAAEEYSSLKDQVASLTAIQDQMTNHIGTLTKQYQSVISEMVTFQRNMVQQDQLMQNMIQYLVHLEQDRGRPAVGPPDGRPMLDASPFMNSGDAQKLIGSYSDVARASFAQMSELAARAGHGGPIASGSGSRTDAALSSNVAPLSPKSHGGSISSESSAPMSAVARKASVFLHPPHFDEQTNAGGSGSSTSTSPTETPAGQTLAPAVAAAGGVPAGMDQAGLRVFTVGTLQPRQEEEHLDHDGSMAGGREANFSAGKQRSATPGEAKGLPVPQLEDLPQGMPKVDKRNGSKDSSPIHTAAGGSSPGGRSTPGAGNSAGDKSSVLRVRRSTYVPGWAVPPRILLVDDDAVCRQLSSKFLQVSGCAIDVAVDGVNAVNKMNLEKYDLVLMDIVMPNLDGVSATSLIREFDPRTPIISMTSNSQPSELMTYMNHGMNDILPKPFTKEGLVNMLEVRVGYAIQD